MGVREHDSVCAERLSPVPGEEVPAAGPDLRGLYLVEPRQVPRRRLLRDLMRAAMGCREQQQQHTSCCSRRTTNLHGMCQECSSFFADLPLVGLSLLVLNICLVVCLVG